MIPIKTPQELQWMREAGARLAEIFATLEPLVQVGVNTWEIDQEIEQMMLYKHLRAECKGYNGYPAVSCISVNDVVVHGIPSKKTLLKSGDFVKVDIMGSFEGLCADMARAFFVGQVSELVLRLDEAARRSFAAGLALVGPGMRLSTVSHAIEQEILRSGFAAVREFAGHGVGRALHEEPEIPNFGVPGQGPILREGMVLAIEPMLTANKCRVIVGADGWTARTENGCLAAHFENTVAVTSMGAEVFTGGLG
jgi:methionyl aminopeptidase